MGRKLHPSLDGYSKREVTVRTNSRGTKFVLVPSRAAVSARIPKPKKGVQKRPRTDDYSPAPDQLNPYPSGPDNLDNPPTSMINENIFTKHNAKKAPGKTSHEYMDEWGRPSAGHISIALSMAKDSETSSATCVGRTIPAFDAWNALISPDFAPRAARIPIGGLLSTGSNDGLASIGFPPGSGISTLTELEGRCIGLNEVDDFSGDPTFGSKPKRSAVGSGSIISVVHTNGFHHLPVFPCFCTDGQPDDIQFLDKSLYPATWKEIRTVFSFELLKLLHLLKVQAHMSSETYTDILRRLTNYIFPSHTLNRKREMARIWQQWNHLTSLKRKGFGHTSPGVRPDTGQLALFCATCPQPMVNLPDGWDQDIDSWKYRRYLVADGNFVLNHPEKKANEDPVWLTDGAGYMVEREMYRSHIEEYKEEQEPPTCYQHRAVSDKNKPKKGYDSTGLVAIACARHGCFAPGSVVDMQKGERQMNTDYAFCHAIANTNTKDIPVALAYDINCQYCINFRSRIERSWLLPELCPPSVPINFVIGLFHVHGHKEDCLVRFAPTYLPGAGVTSGEILESLWSTLNGAANVTRSMTLAHRSEMLDACMGDSNWRKLQGMVRFLIKQYADARKESATAADGFEQLDSTATDTQRQEWKSLMQEANDNRIATNNVSMDVYSVVSHKVPPKSDAQARLMNEERATNDHLGIADWIALAIEIEEEQIRYRSQIRRRAPTLPVRKSKTKKAQKLEVALIRKGQHILKLINQLYDDADELFAFDIRELVWRTSAVEENEEVCVCEGDAEEECFCKDSLTPTDDTVWDDLKDELSSVPLPSDFAELPKGWKHVAVKERVMRVAQADEAAQDVRRCIAHKSWLYRANRDLAAGKRERTRGYDAINEVDGSLRYHIARYTKARAALERLGVLEQYPRFQELTRSHTKAVTGIYNPNKANPTKEPMSWIWSMHKESGMGTEKYVEEVYRVSWIRAASRNDRWSEEVTIIRSEMEWFTRYMDFMADQAAGWAELGLGDGHTAYAYRQADMWRRLGSWATVMFQQKCGVDLANTGKSKPERAESGRIRTQGGIQPPIGFEKHENEDAVGAGDSDGSDKSQDSDLEVEDFEEADVA